MAREIERKFLVRNDSWTALSKRTQRLTDGFVAITNSHKVRVRTYGTRATVTIKTARIGLERAEFEFPIPLADATDLLAHHCSGIILEKTRHHVIFNGLTWEIDVYEGALTGIIVAEIELPELDTAINLPPWIGQEVTFNPDYRTRTLMVKLARQQAIEQRLHQPAEQAVMAHNT